MLNQRFLIYCRLLIENIETFLSKGIFCYCSIDHVVLIKQCQLKVMFCSVDDAYIRSSTQC